MMGRAIHQGAGAGAGLHRVLRCAPQIMVQEYLVFLRGAIFSHFRRFYLMPPVPCRLELGAALPAHVNRADISGAAMTQTIFCNLFYFVIFNLYFQ